MIEELKREIIYIKEKLEKVKKDADSSLEDILNLQKEEIRLKTKLVEEIEGLGKTEEDIATLKEAIAEYKSMPVKPKYSTGVNKIDENLDGGLELAQLVVIAGEKGAGKTLLAMQILYNVSEGFKTMLFSLEMPKWKITSRFLKRNPCGNVLENLRIAEKRFLLEDIETTIQIYARAGVKFFVIDSIMKIKTKKNFKNKSEKYAHISSCLSSLAIKEDIIIFLIAQISKEDIKTKNLALKDSGDVEYDADILLFLTKDKENINKRSLICTKNRQNGNEFKEILYIDKDSLIFRDVQVYMPSL